MSSTRIPVMDQRLSEHSTRALPYRDGRDARRDLHDRPAVSVHGLSASTPPDVDPVFTRLHDGRLHLRARGHHGVWLRDGDTSPLTGAALESKRVIPNLTPFAA